MLVTVWDKSRPPPTHTQGPSSGVPAIRTLLPLLEAQSRDGRFSWWEEPRHGALTHSREGSCPCREDLWVSADLPIWQRQVEMSGKGILAMVIGVMGFQAYWSQYQAGHTHHPSSSFCPATGRLLEETHSGRGWVAQGLPPR